MSILKAACIGIAGTFLALQFQNTRKEYGIYLGIAVSIFLFLGMSRNLSVIRETLELVGSFVKIDAVYLTAMLKILGVTYLAEFAAAICKDAGYQTIAGQIEVFARLSILAIGMPILKASCNPRTWTVKGKKNETLFSEIWHSMHDRTCNLRTDTAGTGICGRGRFLFGKQPDRR